MKLSLQQSKAILHQRFCQLQHDPHRHEIAYDSALADQVIESIRGAKARMLNASQDLFVAGRYGFVIMAPANGRVYITAEYGGTEEQDGEDAGALKFSLDLSSNMLALIKDSLKRAPRVDEAQFLKALASV